MSLLASGFSRYWASFILIYIKGFVGLLVFWFMGYWVYELLDLWDHELMGSLIWFVGFMNFVGYKFLMDFGSMGYRFTDLGNIGFLGVCVFILLV